MTWPTLSFLTLRSRMMRLSGVICGVTLSDSTAFLNEMVVAPLRRRLLVRNFHALLDARFLLVRGDDARRRDDFAAAFGLRGRQLEVDEVVRAEQHEREAAGGARRPAGSRCSGRARRADAVGDRHRDVVGGPLSLRLSSAEPEGRVVARCAEPLVYTSHCCR